MKGTAARKIKQVPEECLIVGIDVHKKKHAAVVMTHDFTTCGKLKFSNSREGFEMADERNIPFHFIKQFTLKLGERRIVQLATLENS